MQCETFEGRLHELLDGRELPESDASLREHALVCSGCAETLAAQEALFAGLAKAEIPAISADFTQRVLANKRPELSHRFFRPFTLGLFVLAAVLLVAVLPTYWLLRGAGGPRNDGSDQGGPGRLVADETNPTLNHDKVSTPQDEREPRSEEESPDSTPAPMKGKSETGTMIAGTAFPNVLRGLPSVHDLPWEVPTQLPGIDQEQAEAVKDVWVSQVATPLKPVTNSVNGAFNVLKRALAAAPDWQLDPDLEEEPQAGAIEFPGTSVGRVS
jgi:hypothetical protein